ncbi:MAG: proton-conducting membrane transporter [Oscillospiraceae bacterium]|nr:proton-conducting membrane transporter [Oscillospiraceae bacterium]
MSLIITILLPALFGLALTLDIFRSRRSRDILVLIAVFASSAAMWMLLTRDSGESFTLLGTAGNTALSLKLDGMGKIYAGIAAALWPVAAVYSAEYMRHDGKVRWFNACFLFAMGAAFGIALSGTILTMYVFCLLLSASTVPLVFHGMTKQSKKAGRTYLIYSVIGAVLALAAVVFVLLRGGSEFGMGGSFDPGEANTAMTMYLVGFMGFGVMAAVFPLHGWMPRDYVVATPVSAVLHAIAVVNAGVFAVIRLTFYTFEADFLAGTWAQYAAMGVTVVTIVFGSTMARREKQIKRRLAYSTCSNASYILFGVTQMTAAGLAAGVVHMVFHAIFKLGAYFAAGAVIHRLRKEYADDMTGLGKRMPVTFVCFTVFGLALTGVPPLNGFLSKWLLAQSAIETGNIMSTIGVCALLYSAFLTAVYMLTISVKAFFPPDDGEPKKKVRSREARAPMLVPMVLLALLCLASGLFGGAVIETVSALLGV